MTESSKGRAAAIDALLAEREWVVRLARRLVADAASADDLVQQVWLRSLRRPPVVPGSLRSWVRVVMRNEVLQMSRSDSRRVARHESAPRKDEPRDPSEIVQRAEEQFRVARAVLDLDEPYRTTILLAFHDDLGPSEIAARMGVPVETVRTRTRRALERLRARFDGERGGDGKAWGIALLPLAGWSRDETARLVASHGTAAAVEGVIVAGTKKAAAVAAIVALMAGIAGTLTVQTIAGRGANETAATEGTAAHPVPASSADDERGVREKGTTRRGDAPAEPATVQPSASRADPASPAETVEITGRVLLDDGTPLAGVAVRALLATPRQTTENSWGFGPPGPSGAADRIRRATEEARSAEENAHWETTDDRGEYRIGGLARAAYGMRAWREGYSVAPVERITNGRACPGESMDFAATLLAAIEADVVGPDGASVQAARITICVRTKALNWSTSAEWSPAQRIIWYPGGAAEATATSDAGAELSSGPVSVDVTPGARAGLLTFRVAPRLGIRGRVILPPDCALKWGRVFLRRLEEGAAPDDAALLTPDKMSHVGEAYGSRFEFADLRAGRYRVGLSIGNSGVARAETIDVRDGVASCELSLADVPANGWLAVRVLAPDGSVIRDPDVSLVSGSVGQQSSSGLDGLRRRDGAVLAPRTSLRLDGDETRVVARSLEHGSASAPVTPDSADVVVRFVAPSRIELVAPAGASDALIAAISFTLQPKTPDSSPPDGFGQYSKESRRWTSAPMEPGVYEIGVYVAGGVATQHIRSFDVTAAAGTSVVDLDLPPLRRLVLRLPGRPRATQVQLLSVSPSGASTPLAHTDKDGVVTFPFVPEGRYRVQAGAERNPKPLVVEVGAGDVEETVPEFIPR